MSEFTTEVLHDSMSLDENNRLGFKVGQETKYGKITHITLAGEVFFEGDGQTQDSWMYDYELCEHNTDEDDYNICLLKPGEDLEARECCGAGINCPAIEHRIR